MLIPTIGTYHLFSSLSLQLLSTNRNYNYCNQQLHRPPLRLELPSKIPLFGSSPSAAYSTNNNNNTPNNKSPPLPPALIINDLTCTHDGGNSYQLQSTSYMLPRNRKIGLVGRNGCGKSTLLRILAEECRNSDGGGGGGGGFENNDNDVPSVIDDGFKYTGTVEKPRDMIVSYVEQEPPSPSSVTVSDALLGITSRMMTTSGAAAAASSSLSPNANVYDVVRRYRILEQQSPQHASSSSSSKDDEVVNNTLLSELTSKMDAMNGWSVLSRSEELASRFGISHLLSSPLSTLSGGERKRVSLASSLLSSPDVLLLDEPTNHLDLNAIRLLEDVLSKDDKLTLLMVSHDRAFLDSVCDGMLELEKGTLYEYDGGGYGVFLEKKEERERLEELAARSASKRYVKELDWMRRQPQARQSKAQARIDAFYQLEKMVKVDLSRGGVMDTDGQEGRRIGKDVLQLNRVNLSFGDRIILDNFSYVFNRGDKIGIVGGNGVGKTTFLNIITGKQPIDGGEISTGETVVFGIYDQKGLDVEDDTISVLDFVKESVERRDGSTMAEAPQEAMKLLKKFEFDRDRWNKRLSVLSGGERRRLQLLSVLTKRPNFLILDEPTNDVDLDTLSVLESYLQEDFKGVLVVVSHDRFFVDKVTDHLFVFEGDGTVKDFVGTLSDYAEGMTEREARRNGTAGGGGAAASAAAAAGMEKKDLYKEDKAKRVERQNEIRSAKKEMNGLEKKIEKLKIKSEEIQVQIDASSDDGWSVLADLTDKLNQANEDIDNMEMRWLELAEFLEEVEVGDN